MNHLVGHTLRAINHNNTQHFKGNQRAEQHHLYKTIKYFNCYNGYKLYGYGVGKEEKYRYCTRAP